MTRDGAKIGSHISPFTLVAASVALDDPEWKAFSSAVARGPANQILPTLETSLRQAILGARLGDVADIDRAVTRIARLSFRWMGESTPELADAFAALFTRWYGSDELGRHLAPRASAFQLILDLASSGGHARAAAAPFLRRAALELDDLVLAAYVLRTLRHD